MENKLKKCIMCSRAKQLYDFHFHKSTKDNLRGECKDCVKQYNKKYQDENKKTIYEVKKIWNKNNRKLINKAQRILYYKNIKIEKEKARIKRLSPEYQEYQKNYGKIHRKEITKNKH